MVNDFVMTRLEVSRGGNGVTSAGKHHRCERQCQLDWRVDVCVVLKTANVDPQFSSSVRIRPLAEERSADEHSPTKRIRGWRQYQLSQKERTFGRDSRAQEPQGFSGSSPQRKPPRR